MLLNRLTNHFLSNRPDIHANLYIQSQIEKTSPQLKPTPQVKGKKLNLGCGFDVRPGWVNIDMHARHAPDIVCDVTDLSCIDNEVASLVVAQDVLEHIHKDKCQSTLSEWNRVMKIGGILEIRVPDVLAIVRLMASDPRFANLAGHRTMLHCLFGTQGYEGDYHFNGFTELTLLEDLKACGFHVVRLAHFDEWLLEVSAEKITSKGQNPLLKIRDQEQFVEKAYLKLLGRKADPSGKQYCLSLLEAQTPKETILTMLAASEEGKAYAKQNAQRA